MKSVFKRLPLFFLLHFGLITQLPAQDIDWGEFDDYRDRYTAEYLRTKIDLYLKKHPQIQNYYSVTNEEFKVYASKEKKKADDWEFKLPLSERLNPVKRERFKSKDRAQPLKDLRVAIDPGHIGGSFAKKEQRYVDMAVSEKLNHRDDIQFDEGTLNLLTAQKLKELLKGQGAEVMLTRKENGKAVIKKSFEEWFEEDFEAAVERNVQLFTNDEQRKASKDWWMGDGKEKHQSIWRILYLADDWLARAQAIKEFEPDITILIHFNATPDAQKRKTKKDTAQTENYNIVFIPGSFMVSNLGKKTEKNELHSVEARYNFVRLLLTDDLEESAKLAKLTIEEFTKELGVGPVSKKHTTAPYLDSACIKVADGVHCRNLALTRRVKGILINGESLIQTHFEESKNLNDDPEKRTAQVAKAYFNAINRYVRDVLNKD